MKMSKNIGLLFGSKKAMTLVEILLYLAILSTLIGTISGFLAISFQSRIKGQTIAEVEQGSAQVLETMTYYIRSAKSVTSPTRGNSAGSLSLVMPGGVNTVDFRLSAGRIEIQKNAGGYVAITSDRLSVTNLSFSNSTVSAAPGTPASVQVNFRTDYKDNSGGRYEYVYGKSFQGSATMRPRQ